MPQSQSRVDTWSVRLAAWAQVATLAVVVFGYFYTVRPIYERDRLQEDVSRLQAFAARHRKEADAALREVREARLLRQRFAEEKAVLQDDIRGLTEQRSETEQANTALAIQLRSLSAESVRLRKDIEKTRKVSRTAQARIFREAVGWHLVTLRLSRLRQDGTADFDDLDGLALRLKEVWWNPEPDIVQYFAGLSPDRFSDLPIESEVLSTEIVNLRDRFQAARGDLACRTPDFGAWETAARTQRQAALAQVDAKAGQCVADWIARLIAANSWSQKDLARHQKTSWWSERSTEAKDQCRSWQIYLAEAETSSRFASAWIGVDRPCFSHVSAFVAKILDTPAYPTKNREMIDWTPLAPPQPPAVKDN